MLYIYIYIYIYYHNYIYITIIIIPYGTYPCCRSYWSSILRQKGYSIIDATIWHAWALWMAPELQNLSRLIQKVENSSAQNIVNWLMRKERFNSLYIMNDVIYIAE